MDKLKKAKRKYGRAKAATLLQMMDLTLKLRDEMQEHFAAEFGDQGEPNRFPVTGGVCSHWHDFAKNTIWKLNQGAGVLKEQSRRTWHESGNPPAGWLKLYGRR